VFGASDVIAVESLGDGIPAATVGVWRVQTEDDSAILKQVKHDPDGHPRWPSSDSESSPYYWRREPLAYGSGLLDRLDGQLRAPRLRACVERADGSIALWLEDAGGRPDWSVERLAIAAERLGTCQGRIASRPPTEPWLGRGWLRAYTDLRATMIESHSGGPFTAEMQSIWARRQSILERVEAAPRTFCHLDLHADNLFGEHETIVVDWAYCGLGVLGEDPGNLVADTLLDGVLSAEHGPALGRAVWESYLAGLAAGTCEVDEDEIRYVFLAGTALKFAWVPALSSLIGLDDPTVTRWLEVFPLIASWAEESRELEARL
jgi:Phosphotransferase enzyme family